jgi:hypothetical protein
LQVFIVHVNVELGDLQLQAELGESVQNLQYPLRLCQDVGEMPLKRDDLQRNLIPQQHVDLLLIPREILLGVHRAVSQWKLSWL